VTRSMLKAGVASAAFGGGGGAGGGLALLFGPMPADATGDVSGTDEGAGAAPIDAREIGEPPDGGAEGGAS
jgi:hypothetical protein